MILNDKCTYCILDDLQTLGIKKRPVGCNISWRLGLPWWCAGSYAIFYFFIFTLFLFVIALLF